jgi:hypothetical protein
MANVTLRKKLSSYLTEGGYLKNVGDEVLYELLVSWENWSGTSKEFYRTLGFTHAQMAGLVGKAKRLKREGYFGDADFKAVKIEGSGLAEESGAEGRPCAAAELVWGGGKVIRFNDVTTLLDFLKKSA